MARYSLFVFIIAASAATAIAAIAPDRTLESLGTNVTVIEKNQAFPLVGPLIVEECITEDCSATRG